MSLINCRECNKYTTNMCGSRENALQIPLNRIEQKFDSLLLEEIEV